MRSLGEIPKSNLGTATVYAVITGVDVVGVVWGFKLIWNCGKQLLKTVVTREAVHQAEYQAAKVGAKEAGKAANEANAAKTAAQKGKANKSLSTQGQKEQVRQFKTKKPNISGKEGAKGVPDWVKEEGLRPYVGESGKDFAKRAMDEKYGAGNYKKGATSEFSKIQKWADRSFE